MPNVGALPKERAMLIIMTMIFAALALDIAYPAAVLSVMALARWAVSIEFSPAQMEGKTA